MPDDIQTTPAPEPTVSPADSNYETQVQLRAKAQQGWAYLSQHPEEATKYGLDPSMFKPADPLAQQFPDRSLNPQQADEKQAQIEGRGGSEVEDTAFDPVSMGVAALTGGGSLVGRTLAAATQPLFSKVLDKVIGAPVEKITGSPTAAEVAETVAGLGLGVMGGGEEGAVKPEVEGEPAPVAPTTEAAPATEQPTAPVSPDAQRFVEGLKPGENGTFTTADGQTLTREQAEQQFNEHQAMPYDTQHADDFLAGLKKIFGEDVETQRRGVRPQLTTLAASENVDPAYLSRILDSPGTALNAEQLAKLQDFASSKGKLLQETAQRILDEPDQAKRIQMLETELKPQTLAFGQWHAFAAGGEAETGRSLNIMQKLQEAKAARVALADQIAKMSEDPSSWEDYVRTIASMKTPEQAAEVAIKSTANGGQDLPWGDKVVKYAMNAALTQPTLPGKKIITDLASNASKIAAYRIGSMITPKDLPRGMDIAAVRGITEGFADALKAGWGALKSGRPEWSIANDARGVYGSEALEGTHVGHALDYTGVMSAPSRLIMSLGEFQKALSYRMELHAQAWKQAAQEADSVIGTDPNKAGDHLDYTNKLYTTLMKTIPKNLHQKALDETAINSFLQDPGITGQHIQDAIKSFNPMGIPLGRLAMLFYRTPLNLLKAEIAHSPLGFIGAVRSAMAGDAGGASLQTAKAGLGSMITALAIYAHHHGILTGNGPGDPELRKTWLLNHKPYSLKVGNHWVSYNNVPLFRGTVAAAADFGDMYSRMPSHDAASMASMLATVVARNVTHMPFMQLITDFADYVTQSLHGETASFSKNANDFLSRLAIPAGVSALTREVDPTQRELRKGLDEWREKIPGLSSTLPPDRNAFGEPHYITGGYKPEDAPGFMMRMENLLSPFEDGKNIEDHDPVYAELNRVGANLAKPSRAMFGQPQSGSPFAPPSTKTGLTLNDKQYDRLQVLAGEGKYEEMQQAINSKWYKQMGDGEKRTALEAINLAHNKAAQDRLAVEDPSIIPSLNKMFSRRAQIAQKGVSFNTP